jgi:methylmalonyl-CoA mutase
VESLTRELALRARAVLDEVEAQGGMARAIESGLPRRRIEAAAARRQARMDRGENLVIGVNAYRPERKEPVEVRFVDPTAVREAQTARLTALRAGRDGARVASALEGLRAGARGGQNLLELSIVAVRARATVGEISEALADVFGRYKAWAGVLGGVYESVPDVPIGGAVGIGIIASRGIQPGRMRTVSYGKERPVCVESNDGCWAQNRRGVSTIFGSAMK